MLDETVDVAEAHWFVAFRMLGMNRHAGIGGADGAAFPACAGMNRVR